ncbi:MAG: ABC transporter permease [Chloroflexota bacterium]|nr:ABC transporter permease [Chloroflexota bacterium]
MSGLFPNAWTVARREYRQRVQTRTFLIVTAVLALVGVGIPLLPVAVRLIAGDETTAVAIHSTDPVVQSQTVVALGAILHGDSDGTRWEITAVGDAAAADVRVRDGDLDGLLTVSRAGDGELAFDMLTEAGPSSQWLFAVRQATTQLSIGDRLVRAGIDPTAAGGIFAPTPFEVTPVDPDAKSPEETYGAAYMMAMIMVVLTFMAVLTYGQWVAGSVAEEKSSRVMELLITAATPRQLLSGKVLGTGAAGLTQYAVVVAAAAGGFALEGLVAERVLGDGGSASLESVNLWVLAPFGVFFVGGFLLYATLYAGLGSMASRQEDVQMATGPMLMVGMVGYFAAFIGLNTPEAQWVQVASLIPFFSPYVLPIRMLLASIEPWEWLVAGGLMVAFLFGALWVAARIYSAGVLLYGQRVNFRAMWRAVRVNR